MNVPLLQLTGITKSFGAVRALKNVSFDLRPGEVHALLGENGAGKSTLIKIVTGAHRPDAGRMEVTGRNMEHLTPALAHKLGITCVYQQPALFPALTVAENIALRLEPASALRRIDWGERRSRAQQLLQRVGAVINPGTEVRRLSMPEQQLVEIACTLGTGARIVIMDEPTASLTSKEQRLLFGVVRSLREAGVGLIYISHRLEEIFALADRVTVLRDGESVGTNKVADIDESRLIKLMIGRELSPIFPMPEAAPGKCVLSLQKIGCDVSGVHNVTLDLRAGEIVGLAGLVGAGRTELARVLFGLTSADTGEILFDGRRVTISSPMEAIALGIAYVPEDRRRHGVILEMPIGANITLAILRRIFPGAWLRFGAERVLALDYIRCLDVKTTGPDALVSSLSGGNQQKVALARWLATKPKLLILDEPTQGVDIGAKSEIHNIIRRLAREGVAVLMISSDLPEVLSLSDRIAVMRNGSITTILPRQSTAHAVMAAALRQMEQAGAA
jgi:rhamnose transport system ATP-binding protein